ncbi:MAG: hypothetical protein AUK47_27750 [Deltaproteobacteria bacterium CG2_30_63_29]|nr:MAG: hypothetical protein AUK47_27750 [Deltaproteobacteria bacterium CG2_30_63_29]PIW00479.1 MAG: hypothetical protein COW42_07690 [Deltaproteobacteria bacterium CG17_big_fil_post_rev_8_21_14_2_50_63_7]PJB35161.1 MAG: hypothetical protein CO108_26565 [Deltaproteobacteria bacterium CG_4_9_14_3_um_filter_63_12]
MTRYALATHWLREAPMNDDDIAKSACLAGDCAVAEHQFERARLAFLLAREQWFKLRKLDSVDAIDETLALCRATQTSALGDPLPHHQDRRLGLGHETP